MVNQVTNNLLEDYHPSNQQQQQTNYNNTNGNEITVNQQQVSLIYNSIDNSTPISQPQQQQITEHHQQYPPNTSSAYSNVSYSSASFSNHTSFSNASSAGYYPSSYSNQPYYYQQQAPVAGITNQQHPSNSGNAILNSNQYNGNPISDQYHNQLIRRNSFNNYEQSTDSEQYLINSYYELSDHLEQPTVYAGQTHPQQQQHHHHHLPEHDQQFIENYHHLNHSSNQIANNHNYIYENYYTNEYLANRDAALNFHSMIIFDPSLFRRFHKRIKHLCSKNLPCMLLVFIPIFFATILILFFVRKIYKSDKTDKNDLHQNAIYAFIIFSILFISPFALFFSIVVINKIIKKYNKCFNPNFINNEFADQFGDLINANSIVPNLTNHLSAASQTLANSTHHSHPHQLNANGNHLSHHLSNANLTANNLANTSHHPSHSTSLLHDHQSPLLNSNQIDLQTSLVVRLNNGGLNPHHLQDRNSAQISTLNTLNVNQLQFNNGNLNNRQLINEMLEELDQINAAAQERALQRMNSIQCRQRLIRQNAFECNTESESDLIYYEDKPPNYELALLCPKKRDCEQQQQQKIKKTETADKKLTKLNSNYVNLNPTDRAVISSSNGGNLNANEHNNNDDHSNDLATLQTELRNNLENRRRSSNGSSVATEPPAYSSLFTSEGQSQSPNQKDNSKQ